MIIDETKCTSCLECIPYCPMAAIRESDTAVTIDLDECVECGVCFRVARVR